LAPLRPTAPIAADALLPGDPARALQLAQELLTKPKMSNHAHGLWGYGGCTEEGRELTIQSIGIGGPSSAIVLAELSGLGVRRAVQVGTCRAIAPALQLGDLLTITFENTDTMRFQVQEMARVERMVSDGVCQVVRKQATVGIDIPSDGEFSKPNFFGYATERLNGLTTQTKADAPTAMNYPLLVQEYPGFMAQYNGMYRTMWMPLDMDRQLIDQAVNQAPGERMVVTGPISLAPVPMLAFSPTVGPVTSPARSPIVTKGDMTTPEWISTKPSATICPCTIYTPGCMSTGSPIETWAVTIATRWAIRGSTGIPSACMRALSL